MTGSNLPDRKKYSPLWGAALLTVLVVGVVALVVWLVAQFPVGARVGELVRWLLATNSPQTSWFITRSAGFVAYLLLWFSTVYGLAVSSKIFDSLLHRAVTFDFHEFLSLLAIGFVLLHVGVLTVDHYMPYSIAQILVPFLSPYRPLWVGIGVIAFYLVLLVSVTFYIRSRIGLRTFRIIHLVSFAGYLGSAVHGLFSGTDSPLPMVQLMYVGTFLVVVFLTTYWLVMLGARPKGKHAEKWVEQQTALPRQISGR
jgi:predicted ferric reductase